MEYQDARVDTAKKDGVRLLPSSARQKGLQDVILPIGASDSVQFRCEIPCHAFRLLTMTDKNKNNSEYFVCQDETVLLVEVATLCKRLGYDHTI